uniref:SEA domain-containing protein n=1 Tax=Biomphalaria glabrata TaxID=6526 RepID=A0A2C9M6Q0_BIOGL
MSSNVTIVTTTYLNVTDFNTTVSLNVSGSTTTPYINVTDFNRSVSDNVTITFTTSYPNVTDFNKTGSDNVTVSITTAYPNVTLYTTSNYTTDATENSTLYTSTPGTTQRMLKQFRVKFRITKLNWTEEYVNKSSAAYTNLSSQLTDALRAFLSRFTSFIETRVLAFSSGSVVADLELSFADINITVEELLQALRNFSFYDIDPDSYNITGR